MTNAESMEAILENAYILIHEKKISSLKDLLPVLEKVAKAIAAPPPEFPPNFPENAFITSPLSTEMSCILFWCRSWLAFQFP